MPVLEHVSFSTADKGDECSRARLACLRGGSGDDRFLLSAKAQFRGRMRAAAFLNMRRVVFRLQLLRAGRETQTVEILLWLRRSSWIIRATPVIILMLKT